MTAARRQLILRSLYRALGGSASEVGDAELLRRFTTARDESAFELLLWRHGAMVLRVCSQVLRNSHDVEDAFQATFLVLARKAGTIGTGESLPGWLYRVAIRIARRASHEGCRRTSQQKSTDLAALAAPASERDQADVLETQRLLHEEVNRLPAKYRLPIVLCYLESRTHEEAARLLGWARGTVAGRLSRARDLLRRRLVRRGLSLATGMLAVELLACASAAAAPASLVISTLRAATLFAAGKATAAAALTRAATLAEGVMRAMFWMKVKVATVVVLLVGLIGSGTALFTRTALAQQPEAPAEKAPAAPAVVAADEPRVGLVMQDAEEEKDGSQALTRSQAESRVNLRKIAQAMNEYQRKHGYYPAPALYSGEGQAFPGAGMMPPGVTPGAPGGGAGALPGLGGQYDAGAKPNVPGAAPAGSIAPGGQSPQKSPPGSAPGPASNFPGGGPIGPGVGKNGPGPGFPFPMGPYVPAAPGMPPGMDPIGMPEGGMPGGRPGMMGMPGMPGMRPGGAVKQGTALLSWRVALLPFLGEEKLYRQIRLDEPWDSAHNKKLLPRMPKVYAPTRGRYPGHVTFYQVFVGPGAAFEKHRQLRPADFLDGTANTFLVVEAGCAVPWTKPEDLHYAADEPIPELGGLFPGLFNAAVVEGSVAAYSTHTDQKQLRAAITRAGFEVVDLSRLRLPASRREAELRRQNERLHRELDHQREQLEALRRERELLREMEEDGNTGVLRKENDHLEKKLRQSREEAERLKDEIRQLKRAGKKRQAQPPGS